MCKLTRITIALKVSSHSETLTPRSCQRGGLAFLSSFLSSAFGSLAKQSNFDIPPAATLIR